MWLSLILMTAGFVWSMVAFIAAMQQQAVMSAAENALLNLYIALSLVVAALLVKDTQ